MKTIICPTDFSSGAENSIKYALEMNKELKAKIILLHTFETPVLYAGGVPFSMVMDSDALHDAAAKKLKAFHKKHFSKNDNVEIILQQGLASSRICETAMEKKADMIVMGASGTGAAERLMVGSNAVRVAQNAHCKVMLIPGKAKFKGMGTMVYATDLSDDNLVNAREIFPMAKKFKSELLFLYIDNSILKIDDEILQKVTKKIKKFVAYGKKSGYVSIDASIAKGVDYFLKKHKADCLIMFHRHRNLFRSLYNPSLAKAISLHTSIPVLILHADDFTSES